MPTEVIMPQMGESIFEGTITKWLKKPGERVEKDEPLFEISTDKVDAEIPAPEAGVLEEIRFAVGDTVEVNTVVALIGTGAAKPAEAPKASETKRAETSQPDETKAAEAAKRQPQPTKPEKAADEPTKPVEKAEDAAAAPSTAGGGTDVVMPQMGESIFEGTITKWLKKAGDRVEKDEPLFEISTDKVDAEIPAPVAGVLREIKIGEGETVQINTVVAVIGGTATTETDAVEPGAVEPGAPLEQGDGQPGTTGAGAAQIELEARATAEPSPAAMPSPGGSATPEPEFATTEGLRSSPLVRRMAREHKLDLRRIRGTGSAGRITKDDVLKYLQAGGNGAAAPTADWIPATAQAVTPAVAGQPGTTVAEGGAAGQKAPAPELSDRVEPMSRMRGIIAQRMLESRQTSPHAYSIYKVDMTRVVRAREKARAAFEQKHGVKLTYMPFIAAAAVEAIRKFPIVNARLEGNAIHYLGNVHLGIAVALEWGLIVPVVREAERQGFADLAGKIADLAERARTKKLKPEEASGSTFTLTNSGVFGGEYGTPILNQPESAILAIGGLKKEPVVLTDAEGNDTIAIRSMQTYCLGFDHRIIDGADAGKFMTEFKNVLEGWNRPLV